MTSRWDAGKTTTNWIDGEVLFAADLNNTFAALPVMIKSAGTKTLTRNNQVYDVDFVDVAFTAGELTANSMVEIIIVAEESVGANNLIRMRVDADNTTANPFSADIDLNPLVAEGSFQMGAAHLWATQQVTNTDIIRFVGFSQKAIAPTQTAQAFSLDTDDTNVFTTAWTLRLNFKFFIAAGTADGFVRFMVNVYRV